MFDRVTIFGPGLLGGSILHALHRQAPATKISIWARREEALTSLRGVGGVETFTDAAEAAKGAGLVILCTPIGVMPDLASRMLPSLSPETIVTDVGSLKKPVHDSLSPLLAGKCQWLGSHPMAGGEKHGLEAARADLFQDAVTILTPAPETPAATVEKLSAFWKLFGCRILSLSPELHDVFAAQISHFPHLMAAALVQSVEDASLPMAGPGFRGITRVAAGDPEMWTEILLSNRNAVMKALDSLNGDLKTARNLLEKNDAAGMKDFLGKACQVRRSLA